MRDEEEIFDGVVGGVGLSENATRTELSIPKDLVVSSALDKQVARLLILHPELRLKFRNNNLACLADETKRVLLKDMQDILGISPLKNGRQALD